LNEILPAAQLFDRIADSGDALTRGYLELTLDIQTCEGCSPDNGDGSKNLTLTLYILDHESNVAVDQFVFATRIHADEESVQKKSAMLIRLMNALVDKYGISAFAQPGDLNDHQLSAYRSYVEYATYSWID
jgi:hypothetical protein